MDGVLHRPECIWRGTRREGLGRFDVSEEEYSISWQQWTVTNSSKGSLLSPRDGSDQRLVAVGPCGRAGRVRSSVGAAQSQMGTSECACVSAHVPRPKERKKGLVARSDHPQEVREPAWNRTASKVPGVSIVDGCCMYDTVCIRSLLLCIRWATRERDPGELAHTHSTQVQPGLVGAASPPFAPPSLPSPQSALCH